MGAYFWLFVLAVLVVVEIITTGLTTVWCAVGAACAYCVRLLGGPLWLQTIVFVLVSVLLIVFLRPIALNHFNINREKTNINSLEGKKGKVTQLINNIEQTGKITIGDIEWSARTEDDDVIIDVGKIVEIVRIEGVKVIVKQTEKK